MRTFFTYSPGEVYRRAPSACIAFFLLAACASERVDEGDLVCWSETRPSMGSHCTITAYGDEELRVRKAVEEAFESLRKAEELLSDYRPQSELSRLNAEGRLEVSSEFLSFLTVGKQYGEASGGAFDITVGALVRLWGFRGGEPRRPSPEQIQSALEKVGWNKIEIQGHHVSLAPGMLLDPGGLGKGWGVDRALAVLRQQGISQALIDFNSNIYALGAPPGRPYWSVGVRDPFHPEEIFETLSLKDESVSNSGNEERFVEIEGVRYGHILDPRSGRPVQGVSGVTVIAASGTETDFLSTAIFVLGTEKGLSLAKERKAEVSILLKNGSRLSTPGWEKRSRKSR